MISIVDTQVGNIASVCSALKSLELEYQLITEPAGLKNANQILIPGVGSFGTGMKNLNAAGFADILREKIQAGTPTLAICLGMQLLCDGSEEAPGVKGLGIIPGVCTALPDTVRVPQLGWNQVTDGICDELSGPCHVAYANSFALPDIERAWMPSFTTYGDRFVAAVYRNGLLACQFHPELSGSYGLSLISEWMDLCGGQRSIDKNAATTSASSRSPDLDSSTIRIIPCLDVAHGRTVKGIRFENLRDTGDPAELAARYESEGADEVVVLDITASPDGAKTQLATVRNVRERLHIPLTVGGGIRSVRDASAVLSAGADKISVNSAAVCNPGLIRELATAFGRQCVVVAIDTRRASGTWEVLINGGRNTTPLNTVTWAVEAEKLGAGEILLTSWDKDGTRDGADIELMESVSASVSIPVICSGGIGSAHDASKAIAAGAGAVLAASIFHDKDYSISSFKQELNLTGIPVRL